MRRYDEPIEVVGAGPAGLADVLAGIFELDIATDFAQLASTQVTAFDA